MTLPSPVSTRHPAHSSAHPACRKLKYPRLEAFTRLGMDVTVPMSAQYPNAVVRAIHRLCTEHPTLPPSKAFDHLVFVRTHLRGRKVAARAKEIYDRWTRKKCLPRDLQRGANGAPKAGAKTYREKRGDPVSRARPNHSCS